MNDTVLEIVTVIAVAAGLILITAITSAIKDEDRNRDNSKTE
jgi:hypothetical protein